MSADARALLVEDNAAHVELLRELLREERGLTLTAVETLEEGLARIAGGGFDIALIDLSLPDAMGLEALTRTVAAAPRLPVVVLTSLDDAAVGLQAMQQGAQDYLVKGTFDAPLFVRSVRYAIERRRAEVATLELARAEAARAEAEANALRLAQLNKQLEESSRGVLALYAELDEKADSLRRTAEVKSRLVSNVSHEFRTPINAILGLCRLLQSHMEGPLTAEQEKQVGFILRSATDLSRLIDDLLELSTMEAGKIRLHATRFEAGSLFTALRGMCRPLPTRPGVALHFDEPASLPAFETDEGKISQILRNLVSNALKFTEEGEVRVTAEPGAPGFAVFRVRDTGIGIAPEHQALIFQEFTQIDGPLQRQVKGTGLGLSLSRKLAELLGGDLTVESAPGRGATFTLTVPAVHPEVSEVARLAREAEKTDGATAPILVVEDDRQTLLLYEKFLKGSGYRVVPARSVEEARQVLARVRPAAVVLDVILEGETSWRFLADLKADTTTRDIPVLVVTVTDREDKARALGADEFWMKPMDDAWLLQKLNQLASRGPVRKVLVVDDDEIARYLVKRMLANTPYRVIEAPDGSHGLRAAREEQPDVILLDFVMPGMSAFEVLDELKGHPDTRQIPVIIHTSMDLAEQERARLAEQTTAILNKQSVSREIAINRIRDALMNAGVTPSAAASSSAESR